MISEKDLERFWSKVKIGEPDECWEWMACKNSRGYGNIYWQGKSQLAHRVSMLIAGEVLCSRKEVAHLCHNPSCCNPEHLLQLSPEEHREMDIEAGRFHTPQGLAGLKQGQRRGESNTRSKLKEKEVIAIYASNLSSRDLAKKYRVHKSIILDIKNGEIWSWLTGHKDTGKRQTKEVLTKDQARAAFLDPRSCRQIAKDLGVVHGTISRLKKGLTYQEYTKDLM